MRTWWWLVVVACKAAPEPPAPPVGSPPVAATVATDAAPAPTWPALGTDLALIRDKDVQLWTAASLPTAAPTVIALSLRIVHPTWAGDHRLYGLAASGADDPIDALIEDQKKERGALVVDTTGAREIPIPMKKMTKAETDALGFPLRAELVAYDDNSVWFVRCWGPKYRPKAAHCETIRRARLDGPETAASSSKARAERPLPAIAAPPGWGIVVADGKATVTCNGTSAVRGTEPMDTVGEAVWLTQDPPLYALRDGDWFTLYRACDDKGTSTSIVAGANGYYAFEDAGVWKLAREGKVVRELGPGLDLVFGP